MKREDIVALAQILSSMKDAVSQMKDAEKKEDAEKLNSAKKELLALKEQADRIL